MRVGARRLCEDAALVFANLAGGKAPTRERRFIYQNHPPQNSKFTRGFSRPRARVTFRYLKVHWSFGEWPALALLSSPSILVRRSIVDEQVEGGLL